MAENNNDSRKKELREFSDDASTTTLKGSSLLTAKTPRAQRKFFTFYKQIIGWNLGDFVD